MKTEIQPDEIRRSNRKTLSMRVTKLGKLIISAPYRCSQARIDAFIQDKAAWIRKQQAAMAKTAIPLPPEHLEGYEFPLLGKQAKITLVAGTRVGYDAERGIIYLPKERSKERLVAWLKQNAKRIFTEVTARQAARMGTDYKSVGVTSARTRWGACSADKSIRYTFRLLYCPKEMIEYVVVHELAHTKHLDHSPRFWAEVAKHLPDWKERRKWVKEHGILLEIF